MKKIFENAVWWSGVVMVGLVLGISLQFVRAWTEPTSAPPGGNVGAPINTGSVEQNKTGWFTFQGGGTRFGTLLATLGGNVGIGMVSPTKKLDVAGEIHATGDICTDQGGGKCLSSGGGIPGPAGPSGPPGPQGPPVPVSSECGTTCGPGYYVQSITPVLSGSGDSAGGGAVIGIDVICCKF